ncbi:addiction module antidote protein, HigA family [Pedobacter changchengzhani]|uniref:Addiction module antidote protein, HigA family n=1 Tax=Pedobacter changchengzhani TaxID=2529274 RepID=A0A4R5MIJ5_9SPHI|nr:HigA family addiction module antitoxin [Pedobacter changchengzhani]TDG35371.1 addiction module antidote protein, HigA family [Pedobacter changchengzhani]
MSTNINQLTPAKAIHPGEILNDELKDRGISQQDFALETGIAKTILNEIIKGKRSINADIALLIGKSLKMDAKLWLNLQNNYDLDLANIKQKTQKQLIALGAWNEIKEYVPYRFYKKHKIISGDPLEDVYLLQKIYAVNNVAALLAVCNEPNFARFRKSEKLEPNKINLIGWVKLIAFEAKKLEVGIFDASKKDELITELKEILKENAETVSRTKVLLAKYGVKLIIHKNPEKCAVDGVSFWSEGKPAIGLSVRHQRIDNFAFTILHELGHVFLHLANDKNAQFIDLDKQELSEDYCLSTEEKEANDFAANALISLQDWLVFMKNKSIYDSKEVIAFAVQLGLHPAIVYGRYANETGNYKIKVSIDKTLN